MKKARFSDGVHHGYGCAASDNAVPVVEGRARRVTYSRNVDQATGFAFLPVLSAVGCRQDHVKNARLVASDDAVSRRAAGRTT